MKDSRAAPGFGEVDLDLGDGNAPPSESKISKRALEVARALPRGDASTRVVEGDALAALSRSYPPQPLGDDEPTSVKDGSVGSVRSESGVASRDDRVNALREAYARGDTEGAMLLASEISSGDGYGGLVPVVEPAIPAPSILTLTQRHSIPRIVCRPNEIANLPLDHRAGFLLSNIDGMQTLEEILDVCGMAPEEALELMNKLEELGAIDFE
jgi:hypothetical protein